MSPAAPPGVDPPGAVPQQAPPDVPASPSRATLAASQRLRGALRDRVGGMVIEGDPGADGLSPRMGGSRSVIMPPVTARETVRQLMVERGGSVLRAWNRFFDKNLDGLCNVNDFRFGMNHLGYSHMNVDSLWEELDREHFEEITLEAVEPRTARLWNDFKKWAGMNFNSPKDMIHEIRDASGGPDAMEALAPETFEAGIRACGWAEGSERLLFDAMDIEGEGYLSARELRWLEAEVRRREGKEAAKVKFAKESHAKAAAKRACQNALSDFKSFLRRRFGGCVYHAWRKALDIDGAMSLQRAELFKACRQLNWKGDVKALWRSLDYDTSGSTTLEELDPQCAQLLAHFREWAVAQFGGKPSAALWRAIDRRSKRRLTLQQFAHEIQLAGFTLRTKVLAKWLDWNGKKHLVEDDFHIFDVWRPPPWLVAEPNPEAAEQLKRLMKQKYGSYVKAWRTVMDKDNSNNCNWHEFVHAAKLLKFNGDVPGAWLALDQDLSGSISLGEIDAKAHAALLEFKMWAIEEFGCVRSAFETIDIDGSNELTLKEFRFAMREYGYPGDVLQLFESLDQGNERRLQYKDVTFLDSWDVPMEPSDLPEEGFEIEPSAPGNEPSREQTTILLEYQTPNPGPGAYTVRSGFGAAPLMPTARHSGAFSFAGRDKQEGWLRHAKTVGPAHYTPAPDCGPQQRRKPAWTFGFEQRPASAAVSTKAVSPGPGSYEAKSAFQGPQFSMGHRWGVILHPLQKPALIGVIPLRRGTGGHKYF